MGRATAEGYAQAVEDGGVSLRVAVNAHRIVNLLPPPPSYMTDVMLAAIEAAQEDDMARYIDLPGGIEWQGLPYAPAHAVISDFRLDAFV